MEAIILAGGLGTRLKSIIPHLPKPMAPINGKPFLKIVLENLARKKFNRVVLSLGYQADAISSYFGDQFGGLKIEYVRESEPLGTGGAIKLALSKCQQDHTFVFNGDTFIDLEVDEVEKIWKAHKSVIIVGRKVSDTSRYGKILYKDDGLVGFCEKATQGPGLINAGCYILNNAALEEWQINTYYSFEMDYLMKIKSSSNVRLFVTKGLFLDIGIPEDYRSAQNILAHL